MLRKLSRGSGLLGAVLVIVGCGASDAATNGMPAGVAGSAPGGAGSAGSAGTTPNGGRGGASASAGSGGALAGMQGGSGGTSGAAAGGNAGMGAASGGGVFAGGASNAAGASGAAGVAGSAGSDAVPSVRIVGRTAPGTGGAVRFSWPGVSLHARFNGTQVSMTLNDGNNKNRFTVVIDGGAPKTLTTTPAQTLQLAAGLSEGAHDLSIWRNTEASPGGVTEFSGLSGFSLGGALLAPASAPDRRMEVIGDSLSVGAGVEGTSTTCSPGIDAFTNNYQAYGSVAARALSADVVTIAWSGIGVYRSYGGTAPTMPERYDYAVPNDETPWNFAQYQPHVVVINLGTNDFSSGNPGQPYIDAYVSFVKHVRSKYASTRFILIDMYGGDRLTAINQVVSTLQNQGEQRVETLSFSSVPNNNTACNSHPNTAAQAAMGNLLAARLKALLGW